jgi:hypothetical protein
MAITVENIRSIDANPGNCHKQQLGHHFSAAVHDAHLMKPGGGKPVGTMICGYRKKEEPIFNIFLGYNSEILPIFLYISGV